jgi:hypothetical protein
MWISEQTAIISLHSNDRLVFCKPRESVFTARCGLNIYIYIYLYLYISLSRRYQYSNICTDISYFINYLPLRMHRNFNGLIPHPRSNTKLPTRVLSHSQLWNRDSAVKCVKAYILMALVANETFQNGLENWEHVSELLSRKKSVSEVHLNNHFHRDVHSQNEPFL